MRCTPPCGTFSGTFRSDSPCSASVTPTTASRTVTARSRTPRGVRRQEHRGVHRFWTMFGAKDAERSTSFNYTGASGHKPFERLMEAGAVEPLIADTLRSFDPRPVPGKFTGDVIITPHCATGLAGTLVRAFDGYALMGGLSPYAGREGENIASPAFSPLNRPADPRFADGADFDDYGVSTRNTDVVRDGVLETFLVDFFCSRKLDRPQNAGRFNLVIPPGESSVDALVRETERGIVFARFSGGVPNHKLDFSGGREELVLRRGRQDSIPAHRDHGERQLPGSADEHPGSVERVRRLRRRRVPLAGRIGNHDFAAVSGRGRASRQTTRTHRSANAPSIPSCDAAHTARAPSISAGSDGGRTRSPFGTTAARSAMPRGTTCPGREAEYGSPSPSPSGMVAPGTDGALRLRSVPGGDPTHAARRCNRSLRSGTS